MYKTCERTLFKYTKQYLFKLFSARRIILAFQSLFEIRMAKFHGLLQSFFRHTQIGLYISFFKNEYIFIIKLIYICYKLPILLRKEIPDGIDKLVVIAMSFFAFLEPHIIGLCLLIIIVQIILRHEPIIHDIIPISNKERL